MLYSLSLSFLYQRDKEAVLLWIAGMIPLVSFYCGFARHAMIFFPQLLFGSQNSEQLIPYPFFKDSRPASFFYEMQRAWSHIPFEKPG